VVMVVASTIIEVAMAAAVDLGADMDKVEVMVSTEGSAVEVEEPIIILVITEVVAA